MSELVINGGKKLSGEICVQGAKNSVLPVLAASDVETSLKILAHLGCGCKKDGDTVAVNARDISDYSIPDTLMREMRSSVVFLGAVIGRTGKAVISSPGGCELGPRPIDLHLSSLNKMGVTVKEEHGYLNCTAENGLHGAEISRGFG